MTRVIDTYELSPMQAGMLFHAVSEGASGVDIEQVVATLHEPLDEVKFLRAWQRVANRHSILRSRLRWERLEVPVQDVVDEIQIPVEQFEWRALAEPERHQRFQALLDRDRVRGFDLQQAPLMRLTLVSIAEREHWVVWTFHHALLDGRSFPLVLREVFVFYEAFSRGEDADLPLPRPYRDYIEWLRKLDMDSAKAYWRDALAGFRAPTPLVVTRDRQAEQVNGTIRGAQEVRLSTALTTALTDRARDASVTVNTLLQGVWALLLHRYSGEPDVVFGATRACRKSALGGADDMVGLFINTLPIRVSIDPEAELVPWLQQLRAQQVALRDYEHTPLVQVRSWSEVPRGEPLFESIVVFDNQSLDAQLRAPGGAWSRRHFEYRGQTNFPLTVIAYADRELLLQIEYTRRRFADDAVARMLGHLQILLEGITDRPRARLKELPLLTDAERHQLQVEWNAMAADYSREQCVHALFEVQVARTPERTAVKAGAMALSYAELEARANRLAQVLRSRGVGRGERVGLCVERGAEMLAAVLGILKAGAAYVPLDPLFPQERLRFMAEDAQLALLVSTSALAEPFGLPRERQLLLDADAKSIAAALATRLPVNVRSARPEDPAYVIYTSGSTGKPKGVVVPHRAVVNFLTSMAREPGLAADDVLVAVTTLSFDIAVLELQLPLTVGATVVIASRDEAMDGQALKGLLEQHRANVMQATPVTWRLLLQAGWKGGKDFKALVGGEALPKDLAEQLLARGVELWNLYGPTETTVWSTCARITDTANGIRIGKPIANTTVYILDAHRNLCPIGVAGELCIGGAGVTLGYWRRPELTAERFIADPFSATPRATLYRTGDRARWRSEGTLEHLGRLDFQIKIRGYRIELGEIQASIARHPAIREVVAIAREDVPGDRRLVAYLITENPPVDLVEQLRALLRASLPEHMVPSHFVSLEALPLTPNGKLDRKALPAPSASLPGDGHSYAAPRTPAENAIAQIWTAVLGIERVGVNDNFFDLGGHSLLLLRAHSRLRASLQPDLSFVALMQYPTVRTLASYLSGTAEQSVVPAAAADRARKQREAMLRQRSIREQR
jgi:amino acid adenylation domain-containing protein